MPLLRPIYRPSDGSAPIYCTQAFAEDQAERESVSLEQCQSRILRDCHGARKNLYLETFGCQINAHDSKGYWHMQAAGLPSGRV